MTKKYTKRHYNCAQKEIDKGTSVRETARRCGFDSPTPIRYNLLGQKDQMQKSIRAWHEKNKERKAKYDAEYTKKKRLQAQLSVK